MKDVLLRIFWPNEPMETPRSWGAVFVWTVVLGGFSLFLLSKSTVNSMLTSYQQDETLLLMNSLLYLTGFWLFFIAVVLPFSRAQTVSKILWRSASLIFILAALFVFILATDETLNKPASQQNLPVQHGQSTQRPTYTSPTVPQAPQIQVQPPTTVPTSPPSGQPVDEKLVVRRIMNAEWVERQDNLCSTIDPPFCLFTNENSPSRFVPRLTWDAKIEFAGLQDDGRVVGAKVDCRNKTIELLLPGQFHYIVTKDISGSNTFGGHLLATGCRMLR